MARENTEEREFVRVETQLPLHYRQLSPGEYRRQKGAHLAGPAASDQFSFPARGALVFAG
jgi:hypothetical protein